MERGEEVSGQGSSVPKQASATFLKYATSPPNIGILPCPSGRGSATGICGDSIEVFIQVEEGKLDQVLVMPHGCVYTVACASATSILATGLSPEEALALEENHVDQELEGLPEDHLHCARLAINALADAIGDYWKSAGRSGPAQGER